MRTKGAKKVGRFSVEFEVANFGDLAAARSGLLDPEKVRRRTIRGVVDSGAHRLVLPGALVKRLGLVPSSKVRVRYADGRRATRDAVDGVYLTLQGRHGTFTAVVEPGRRSALLGAIVLEDLDFLVDCVNERLIPRDPRFVISEIE
jgi:predicted aspartyl protease